MAQGRGPTQPPDNAGISEAIERPRHAEDWQLVQDCISGDRARWAELITNYEPALAVAIRQTLQSRGRPAPAHLVEDIQADIAVGLVKRDFRKLRSFSGRCRLGAWLKIVANHHTIDHLRRQRPTVSLSDSSDVSLALRNTLASTRPAPDAELGRKQRVAALKALYDRLSAEDRRFVSLFFEQGLDFEAVAEAMDTTVGAVYARKNRVRKKLLKMARAKGLDGT